MQNNPTPENCTTPKDIPQLYNDKFPDPIFKSFAKMLAGDEKISLKGLERILDCGTFLQFLEGQDCSKLHRANFCKFPLCPMCQWRLFLKDSLKLKTVATHIANTVDCNFVFLTLTIKNVPKRKLQKSLDHLAKSFERFMQRQALKKIRLGYTCKLEITYNKVRNDFHPHLHVILAVKPDYFHSPDYITHDEFVKRWQHATRDKSNKVVHIQAVKGDDKEAIAKYLAKMAIYMAKPEDLANSFEVYSTYYDVLKGKRRVNFGGIFREASSLYESGGLNFLLDLDQSEYQWLVSYRRRDGQYKEVERYPIRYYDPFTRRVEIEHERTSNPPSGEALVLIFQAKLFERKCGHQFDSHTRMLAYQCRKKAKVLEDAKQELNRQIPHQKKLEYERRLAERQALRDEYCRTYNCTLN